MRVNWSRQERQRSWVLQVPIEFPRGIKLEVTIKSRSVHRHGTGWICVLKNIPSPSKGANEKSVLQCTVPKHLRLDVVRDILFAPSFLVLLRLRSYILSARKNTCWHGRSVLYFVSVVSFSSLLCRISISKLFSLFEFFFSCDTFFPVQILNVKEGYCVRKSSCVSIFLLVCNVYFLSSCFCAYIHSA